MQNKLIIANKFKNFQSFGKNGFEILLMLTPRILKNKIKYRAGVLILCTRVPFLSTRKVVYSVLV